MSCGRMRYWSSIAAGSSRGRLGGRKVPFYELFPQAAKWSENERREISGAAFPACRGISRQNWLLVEHTKVRPDRLN